jgi:hypothetical protein
MYKQLVTFRLWPRFDIGFQVISFVLIIVVGYSILVY